MNEPAVELRGRKHYASVVLENRFLLESDEEHYKRRVEHLVDGLVISVRRRVYGYPLQKFAWPLTWWDAFKERFFPRWLRPVFPVRYRTLDLSAIYPTLNPRKLTGHEPHPFCQMGFMTEPKREEDGDA